VSAGEAEWKATARSMRAEGASYDEIAREVGVSASSVWRLFNPSGRTRGPQPLIAEAKRKQWADPEWAARQRAKISAGMHASERVGGFREPLEAPKPYDPLRDNPRMKRLLGGAP
jgi:transposase